MTKRLFNELVESIKEAGRIHRGEIRPWREFVIGAKGVPLVREELYTTHENCETRRS